MKPKQEAKESVDKFYEEVCGYIYEYKDAIKVAKQCDLICVDAIIKEITRLTPKEIDKDSYHFIIKYWQRVKQEIQKL